MSDDVGGLAAITGWGSALDFWRFYCRMRLRIRNAAQTLFELEVAEQAVVGYEAFLARKEGNRLFGKWDIGLYSTQDAPERMKDAVVSLATSQQRDQYIAEHDTDEDNRNHFRRIQAEYGEWSRIQRDLQEMEQSMELVHGLAGWLTGVAQDLVIDVATAGAFKALTTARRVGKTIRGATKATREAVDARRGFGMAAGRDPTGAASDVLREKFLREARSPEFRRKAEKYLRRQGVEPVDWDDFMHYLDESEYRDMKGWAENRRLGSASRRPGTVEAGRSEGGLFSVTRPLRWSREAFHHELLHGVQMRHLGVVENDLSWLSRRALEARTHYYANPRTIGAVGGASVVVGGLIGWALMDD